MNEVHEFRELVHEVLKADVFIDDVHVLENLDLEDTVRDVVNNEDLEDENSLRLFTDVNEGHELLYFDDIA